MKYEENGKNMNCSMSYNELITYVNDKNYKWKNQSNKAEFDKSLDDNDERHWRGGIINDILNHSNFPEFCKKRNELSKSTWINKINMATVSINKRKRQLNEHDGEYILERKYDITPFNRASRVSTPTKAIEIVADFSISSGTSSDSINTYGSYVWSISQILEQLGINTKIIIKHDSYGRYDNDSKITTVTNILIKNYNEYISPIALSDCFTSVFYRRITFAGWIKLGDENNKTISWGYGTPKDIHVKNNIEFKDGKIYMKPGGIFEEKHLENEILKALGMR